MTEYVTVTYSIRTKDDRLLTTRTVYIQVDDAIVTIPTAESLGRTLARDIVRHAGFDGMAFSEEVPKGEPNLKSVTRHASSDR